MTFDRHLPPSSAAPVSPTVGTAFATQPVTQPQMAPNSVGAVELVDPEAELDVASHAGGFVPPWADVAGAALSPARYYVDDLGIVHLHGQVRAVPTGAATPTQDIFGLTTGHWPDSNKRHTFLVPCNGGAARVDVIGDAISGVGVAAVSFEGFVGGGDAAWIALDGITFRAYH